MWHDGTVNSKGQGRDRGSGGYKSTRRNRNSSSFKPSRIKESASSDSGHSDDILAPQIDTEDSSSGSSDNEEDRELNKTQSNSYNMLLQHLAATSQPPHKKRKMNETETVEDAERLEDGEDLVEGPEDMETLAADDLTDSGDEVGPERGDYGPFKI